jgi:hypothetical protein
MAEEAANIQEMARLVDYGCGIDADVALLEGMQRVGIAMWLLGHTARAHQLEAALVGLHTRVLGPQHPDTLTAAANSPISMTDMGDLPGACELAAREGADCTHQITGPLAPAHPHGNDQHGC